MKKRGMKYFSDVILALLEAANDKDETVRKSVSDSLQKLGLKQSQKVLQVSHGYLKVHNKVKKWKRFKLRRKITNFCSYLCPIELTFFKR